MEEIFDLEGFTLRECRAMLMGLNEVNIKGVDARFMNALQIKLHEQIMQIENHISEQSNNLIQPPTPPIETE
jgi:hypothetical protein|tara:strand:+ start:173 stop:388 length:216 start_codon:yes stop_codon:yes gene_type:complete